MSTHVCFGAPRWCGPCKLLGPRLESLIASRDGSVVMAKVDIDEHSDIALDHGVSSVCVCVCVRERVSERDPQFTPSASTHTHTKVTAHQK